MANPQPNDPMAQMLAQIQQLQNKLQTVCNANTDLATQLNTLQNAGVAAQITAPAPQAPTFALTPATSNLTGLLDYSSKLGGHVYKEGCKKLTNDEGFAMTPATTATFVKVFAN
jgi:hypothetical protein